MLTLQRVGRRASWARAGRPSPMVQVRIVDPDGNEVPPGEIGEIVARGPTVMNGYHNRPERQRRAPAPAAGTTPTTSAGARPTARSRFVGPEDPDHQVGGREHLPRRGRGLPRNATPRCRRPPIIGVPDQTWAQSVKAIVVLKDGETRDRRRASSSTAARTSRRTRSRARSSSSTSCPATAGWSTTTRSTSVRRRRLPGWWPLKRTAAGMTRRGLSCRSSWPST